MRASRWNACSTARCSWKPGCACAKAGPTTKPRCDATATPRLRHAAIATASPRTSCMRGPGAKPACSSKSCRKTTGAWAWSHAACKVPKRHVLRAALQPMQHIRLDAVQQGELAQLRQAEALDAAPLLAGEARSRVLRQRTRAAPRAARRSATGIVRRPTGEVRAGLAGPDPVAWTLRRFERDLLDAIGFGFRLRRRWRGPDRPRRALSPRPRTGRAPRAQRPRAWRPQCRRDGPCVVGLAARPSPTPDDLTGLRRAMRQVLLHLLGARGLKSWDLSASWVAWRRDLPPAIETSGRRVTCGSRSSTAIWKRASANSECGSVSSARTASSSRRAPTKPQLARNMCSVRCAPCGRGAKGRHHGVALFRQFIEEQLPKRIDVRRLALQRRERRRVIPVG